MEIIRNFDVMIVGAGPAGISTWLHLMQDAPGLADQTVVIDQAVFPRPKLCAGGVGAWSTKVLNHLNIDLKLPSLTVSQVAVHFEDQSWHYHAPNDFQMIPRIDFDMALVKAAADRGMVLHEGERFIDARYEQDALVVRTGHGLYAVKALIGADGALSRVRRAMMPFYANCLAPTIQVSVPVDSQHDQEFDQRVISIDFSPVKEGLQGYVWHCPCYFEGTPCMNHGIVNFRFPSGCKKVDLKKLFGRVLKNRRIDPQAQNWSSHPIRWLFPEGPLSRSNVLLVGDAAGIEPALGGGIHLALSYGGIAATVLNQAFERRDFSFRSYDLTVNSHFMGRHIRDYTRLAEVLYDGNVNPLEQLRQFFTDRMIRHRLMTMLPKTQSS